MIFKVSRPDSLAYKNLGYISLCESLITDIFSVIQSVRSANLNVEFFPTRELNLTYSMGGGCTIRRITRGNEAIWLLIRPITQDGYWSTIHTQILSQPSYVDPQNNAPLEFPLRGIEDEFLPRRIEEIPNDRFDEVRNQIIRELEARHQQNE